LAIPDVPELEVFGKISSEDVEEATRFRGRRNNLRPDLRLPVFPGVNGVKGRVHRIQVAIGHVESLEEIGMISLEFEFQDAGVE
jgi:hypothetical protein